jgi:hypothetical protein
MKGAILLSEDPHLFEMVCRSLVAQEGGATPT